MSRIRLAVAGVGNCASSLLQGIAHYAARPDAPGLMTEAVGGYAAGEIEPVAAFDIDARKVGRPLREAVFAAPNCTKVFCPELPAWDVRVKSAPVLDGVAEHMGEGEYSEGRRFVVTDVPPVDVAAELRAARAQVLVNYLPVGSLRATEALAEACLRAGVAMVNCIPVFIASDPAWAGRFRDAGLPVVGDDIKAQLGATITHRTLARLFEARGVKITGMYQLNTGGNTDFLNMLDRSRLATKKQSKTEAVTSQLQGDLPEGSLHVGPSDYVPFLKDNKVCFLRIEGEGFGGVPLNLELRLSVEDSPNSAACVVDAIRAAQAARDRGLAGAIEVPSAWLMKHPPVQLTDTDAAAAWETWAGG